MRPTKTRGATHNYAAPKSWDSKLDGECGDLQVRVQLHGKRGIIDNVSTWKPSAADIAHFNRGGVLEVSVLTPTQPPIGLCVVDPVDEVIVDDVLGTKAITINEAAHGDVDPDHPLNMSVEECFARGINPMTRTGV